MIPCRCEHCGHTFKTVAHGGHRVACGDSTSHEVVKAATGEHKATVCLTDPPYGLGDTVSVKNEYDIFDDSVSNLDALVARFFPILREICKIIVLTPGNRNQYRYPPPTWTMAWFVPAGTGRGPWGFCCWQPILCYGKDPKLTGGKGSHPDAIVHTESAEKNGHPCPKPINFWTWLMERTSEPGDTVLDIFLGSGTGLIAAERSGRTLCGIELSPAYCDVSVRRWMTFTGKRAVNETTGEAFPA